MTRFLITLAEAVDTVFYAFEEMKGSEIFVRKSYSVKITDLAKSIAPEVKMQETGMRPGEKLHEQLISADEANFTYDFDKFYKILSPLNNWDNSASRIKGGKKVNEGFTYTSDSNDFWLKGQMLDRWLHQIEC